MRWAKQYQASTMRPHTRQPGLLLEGVERPYIAVDSLGRKLRRLCKVLNRLAEELKGLMYALTPAKGLLRPTSESKGLYKVNNMERFYRRETLKEDRVKECKLNKQKARKRKARDKRSSMIWIKKFVIAKNLKPSSMKKRDLIIAVNSFLGTNYKSCVTMWEENGKAKKFTQEELNNIKKHKNHRKIKAQNYKHGDSFYKSDEWRSLRYKALALNDGCCVLCGRSRRKHDVVLHVDHIKPRSKYPQLELDISNLQILCEDCNLGKSNRDCIDWREG